MEGVAGYFPVDSIHIYKQFGRAGVLDELDKIEFKVTPEFTFNEDALDNGQGKVFIVEGKGTIYSVYLLNRIEKDGSTYEYWLLNGKEKDVEKPFKRLRYVIVKVDTETEKREGLKHDAQPYPSYTTEAGTVIELPPVDKTLLN